MMPARFRRAAAYVLLLTLVFIAAVAGIAYWLGDALRAERLRESEMQAQHFANGAEAAINRSLLGVDVLLASMDDLLNLSHTSAAQLRSPTVAALLQKTMRQNLLVGRVALSDAHGVELASSQPGAPGRSALPKAFLDAVLRQAVATLVISAPATSFQSSERILYMARRVPLRDGTVIVCVAEVSIPQLTAVLVQGADIAGLEATVERGDGELLLAAPSSPQSAAARLSPPLRPAHPLHNAVPMRSRLSQQEAVVAVREVLYNNLYITASIPRQAALQDWLSQVRLIAMVGLAIVLLIVSTGTLVLWYVHRLSKAQRSIAQGKAVLDQALESMESGFILLNAERQVLTWNRRFLELHPWLKAHLQPLVAFAHLLEASAVLLLPHADAEQRRQWVAQRLAHLNDSPGTHQITHPSGTILEISERPTADSGRVIVYQDVTRLRHAMAEIELLAFFDPLTGLPNRRLLNDRLQQCLHACVRSGRLGALLFLDLDHFKTLNDTAGHAMGDLLLQQVAQRLKACVRDGDTVARLGGDEFVVMLQNLHTDPREAQLIAQRVADAILASVNRPYALKQTDYNGSCSIGATLFGHSMLDASDLLKEADIAMYQVKNAGRNGVCFFNPAMLVSITDRAEIVRDLRHAQELGQLLLYYQVQVSDQGQPIGAEALLRWHHPERGLTTPGHFIGLAEESGLILPIGEWVLRSACQQLRLWESQPHSATLELAVNVSARQFRHPDFVGLVQSVLQETGAQARRLKLELTESMVLEDVADTILKMQQLRALGVRLSLDDFGTGYSSLAYLAQLPLNQLKIDQSFVRNIGLQAGDSAIIDTIISLARSLSLDVIAEGVETTAQRDFLAAHGCRQCQGYLFGQPLPLAAFEARLLAMAPPPHHPSTVA